VDDFLSTLTALIADRKAHPKAGSYTNELLANQSQAAQKVGEEAVEVVIAALSQSDERLVAEMADLVYHSLVLLEARNLSWADVIRELEKRYLLNNSG
jgi:phosphoribosyl-ATP pyrophosphohydrolase